MSTTHFIILALGFSCLLGIFSHLMAMRRGAKRGWRRSGIEESSGTRRRWQRRGRQGGLFQDPASVIWCARLLNVDQARLEYLLEHIQSSYSQFWIPKRRGGYRMIAAPSEELREVQRAIYHRVLRPMSPHGAAMGFRPKRSIADNARPHLGHECVLKVDLHDFFPSIRSLRVRRFFLDMGYPAGVAKVLTTLCCRHRCLPQGAPTSPPLSNLLVRPLDERLHALAQQQGLTYTRYADDLTFSGISFDPNALLAQVDEVVREQGFVVNVSKTRFSPAGRRKIITGISIASGTKLTVPKASKRAWRQVAHYVLCRGVEAHCRRIGYTGPAYLKRLIGSFAYWKSIEPENEYVKRTLIALRALQRSERSA